MKRSVKRFGIAIGNMRLDGIRMQDVGKGRPKAKEARERLIDGEAMGEAVADQQKRLANEYGTGGSLTDALVKELGGSRTAENQANAYRGIIGNIKAGGRTGEPSGSLAEQARERMIDRQGGNDDTENGGHPDTGKDKADRRAYPKGTDTRKDSAEEAAARNYAEAGENAKAWANAGRC